jgi:hypothetical protein
MASYQPPIEDLAIFDSSVFLTGDEPLTYNIAVKKFLKYPNAQGEENLLDTNVNGYMTLQDSNDNLVIVDTKPTTITTGSDNILIGNNVGSSITTAQQNILMGNNVFLNNTFGQYNTCIGENIMINAPSGPFTEYNTIIGHLAGKEHLGSQCVFIGAGAGEQNTTGTNTYIGTSAGTNVQGDNNIGIGNFALGGGGNLNPALNINDRNMAIGSSALYNCSTGTKNVAIGTQSLYELTTGSKQVAIGDNCADLLQTGIDSVFIGSKASQHATTGTHCVILGANANDNVSNTAPLRNTCIGADTDNMGWIDSTAIGYGAENTAANQIILGRATETVSCPGTLTFKMASDNTSGTYYIPFSKVAGGNEGALFVDSTTGPLSYDPSTATLTCAYTNLSQGIVNPNTTLRNYFYTNRTTRPTTADNICIGHQAGNLISTGINNLCIGTNAGQLITSSSNNTCLGHNAGRTIAGSVFNNTTCVGSNAGQAYANEKSVFVGAEAGFNSFNGGFNTCTGYQAGYTLTSGSGNTVYGALANQVAGNTNLTNSTSIGYQANNANFSTSVALGYQATNTAANQIRLGTLNEVVSCPNLVQVNSSYDAISVSANVSLFNTTTTGNVTLGNAMTTGGLTFGANLTSGNVVFGNATSGSPSSSFTIFPRGGWSGVFQVGGNSSSANFLCATNLEVNYPIKTSVTTAPTNVRHLGYSVVQSTAGWTTSLTAGTNTNITSQLFGINDLGTWLFEAIIIYQLANNTSARQLQLDITTVSSTTIAEYSSIEYSTANVGEPTMKTQRIINIYAPITVHLVGRTNGSNSTIVTTGSNGIFKWTRIG